MKRKKIVAITLTDSRHTWLKDYVAERGSSVSSFFESHLYEFSASLASDDKKEKES